VKKRRVLRVPWPRRAVNAAVLLSGYHCESEGLVRVAVMASIFFGLFASCSGLKSLVSQKCTLRE
jgi:hypothetical protein